MEGSFPCVVGKEFPAFPSHLKRRCSPQENREELQGHATIPRVPQMSQSIPGKPVFPALPRLSSRGSTHTTVARGTTLWESLVGKPHGKASTESHRSLDPSEEKRDTAATVWEESTLACPHSRRGLTPLGRLQKYSKIHVSTGEESSLYWPFLRPPERVPEDPVVSQKCLPQLEKIQEVLPSRRDEAHFR